MDFTITVNPPITVNIGGKSYSLKRFLRPAFAKWAAEIRAARKQEVLEQFKSDTERAQHLQWWEPPVLDMGILISRARSPEDGDMGYVLDVAMKEAGVPDDERKQVLDEGDPTDLLNLATQLTMSKAVAEKLNAPPQKPDAMGESGSSSESSASVAKPT